MENFKKIGLILISALFLFSVSASFCLAEDKPLETQYPQVPGVETPTTVKTPLPQYVKYIFNFAIWIAGFVAFAVAMAGGVRYLTSAGNPSITGDAKDQIFSGILGLVILLSSWMILHTLNPQLVVLKTDLPTLSEPGEIIGVYLCLDSSKQDCIVYQNDSATLSADIDNKVRHVFFKNSTSTQFGAVLHEDRSFQGNCQVFLSEGTVSGAPSSITVFQNSPASGQGVSFYECKEYNTQSQTGSLYDRHQCQRWPASGGYTNEINNAFEKEGESIKIEGNYLAVVWQKKYNAGECEVFRTSDPNIDGYNNIGLCGGLIFNKKGCFGSIRILPIK